MIEQTLVPTQFDAFGLVPNAKCDFGIHLVTKTGETEICTECGRKKEIKAWHNPFLVYLDCRCNSTFKEFRRLRKNRFWLPYVNAGNWTTNHKR